MSVRKDSVECEVLATCLVSVPNLSVETSRTSVKSVLAVVYNKAVLLAVELELTVTDTVTETTDKSREVRLIALEVLIYVIKSLNDIGNLAILVRNHDCYDSTTIVRNCYFVAFAILKNVEICLLSVDLSLEVCGIDSAKVLRCAHDYIFFSSY